MRAWMINQQHMQGKAGRQAVKNLRKAHVLDGLVNNVAMSEAVEGGSGTTSNEQFHRILNKQVPQESVTRMHTKLECVVLVTYFWNGAIRRHSGDSRRCYCCCFYLEVPDRCLLVRDVLIPVPALTT